MICAHCEEEILPGDRAPNHGADLHHECFLRGVVGSVGHLRQQCSCFGGTEEDPPGLTKREAAKAAVELWEQMREQTGDDSIKQVETFMRSSHLLHWILNKDGNPVPTKSLMAWARFLESPARIVKQEQVGRYEVSTVFLGLDHRLFGKGPPVLWETMVFGKGPLAGNQERCAGNREQAEAMHLKVVNLVKSTLGGQKKASRKARDAS